MNKRKYSRLAALHAEIEELRQELYKEIPDFLPLLDPAGLLDGADPESRNEMLKKAKYRLRHRKPAAW